MVEPRQVVERVEVDVYELPTEGEQPESDGTLAWSSTTMVVVHVAAGGVRGMGYSYTHAAAARVIEDELAGVIRGRDAMAVRGSWCAMLEAVRNFGRQGVVASAISAVDIALWDLRARLLDAPLAATLGHVHDRVPVYGSGGFTSLSLDDLQRQLRHWVDLGIPRVKMKVGRDAGADAERVRVARDAVGHDVELMVDANGAYSRKQALQMAGVFADFNVRWYEEPVSSDDLDGLRLVRDQGPPGLSVAAGEYGWDSFHFRDLLEHGCVDVLQADVTRCLGITGFLTADALCQAHCIPLSAHCAPGASLHVCAASPRVVHIEYFRDHERFEQALFDGMPIPRGGALAFEPTRPGHGLNIRPDEAKRLAVS